MMWRAAAFERDSCRADAYINAHQQRAKGGGGGGGGEGGGGGGRWRRVSTDIQCINLLSQPILPLWTNPIMQPHRILSSLSGGPSTQAQPSSQFGRCRKQP